MNMDERNERSGGYRRIMANLHLVMGVVFLVIGGLVLWNHKFGLVDLEAWQTYGLGALLVIYGIFRLWRGVTDLRR